MRTLLAFTAAALLSLHPLSAKPPHAEEKQQGKKEKHQKKHQKKESRKFSTSDRQKLKGYYRNLPPGLAKKQQRTGSLPKGWETNVHTGQRLPESYRPQLEPVPRDLEQQLQLGPVGTEIRRIGDKIIRLEQATGMIMDVFEL